MGERNITVQCITGRCKKVMEFESADLVFRNAFDTQRERRVRTQILNDDCLAFYKIYNHHDETRKTEPERRGHNSMLLKEQGKEDVMLEVGNMRIAVYLSEAEIYQQTKEGDRQFWGKEIN